jgi:hypothetical protein
METLDAKVWDMNTIPAGNVTVGTVIIRNLKPVEVTEVRRFPFAGLEQVWLFSARGIEVQDYAHSRVEVAR